MARLRGPLRRGPLCQLPSVSCPVSLAQPIWSLCQRLDAIEALARRDVKSALVRSRKCDVGALASRLDRAEVAARGVEHLHTGYRRDVETVVAIDRHAVGAAFGARRNIAQLG